MTTLRMLVIAVLLLVRCPPAEAEGDIPSGTITVVAPFAPGGGIDFVARLVAENLQERLGQPVVVENRVGGGGAVAATYVARAAPDGRTLFLLDSSATLLKWLQSSSVGFDVIADFAPIALVCSAPLVLFANPSVPAHDVQSLIAYANANPGKLSVGSPGIGTPHHLAAAMFNQATKVDIAHVPYRGTSPALADLVGGQISLIWATPVAVMPFVAKGQAKALVTFSPQRIRSAPDVPTMTEAGLPSETVQSWFGIAAPAGTPPAVTEKISKLLRDMTERPDVQKRLDALGYDLTYLDREQFRERIATEHHKFGEVIRAAGLHSR